MLRALLLTTTFAAALGAGVLAQSRDRHTDANDCADRSSNRASYCEVREETLGGANPLDVDTGGNGGITVRGWDRGDVLMRARIIAHADSDAEARRIASGVRIDTAGGNIRADGPRTDQDSSWSVTIELNVPRSAILTLNTRNGGISMTGFSGQAKLHTVNGGVTLSNVNGDIRGETKNGGLSIDLAGDHWDGQGLDVETHNGGVKLTLPQQYSAALETSTVNGRISVDFPVTVQGRIGRELSTTLGAGGAKIRAVTTNGGVSIRQR
jgi:putative adhesin